MGAGCAGWQLLWVGGQVGGWVCGPVVKRPRGALANWTTAPLARATLVDAGRGLLPTHCLPRCLMPAGSRCPARSPSRPPSDRLLTTTSPNLRTCSDINRWFGASGAGVSHQDVFDHFTDLRKLGVRLHYWP